MKPVEHDIYNERGDSFQFTCTLPKTVTVESMYFSIKVNKKAEDYVVHKSIGDGIRDITEQGAENQTWRIRVAPEDTNEVKPRDYYYDFQLGLGADIYTVMEGIFAIGADITREVS